MQSTRSEEYVQTSDDVPVQEEHLDCGPTPILMKKIELEIARLLLEGALAIIAGPEEGRDAASRRRPK